MNTKTQKIINKIFHPQTNKHSWPHSKQWVARWAPLKWVRVKSCVCCVCVCVCVGGGVGWGGGWRKAAWICNHVVHLSPSHPVTQCRLYRRDYTAPLVRATRCVSEQASWCHTSMANTLFSALFVATDKAKINRISLQASSPQHET